MKEWTGVEIERARQGLEQAAATTLGRLIFEFSRLDMNLGLMLVHAYSKPQLGKPTKEISECTFHEKLKFLDELVQKKYQGKQEAMGAHAKWLEQAHEMRMKRNDLIHGRWGVDPMKSQVINVVGLPTGEQQSEQRYTIQELKDVLLRMQQVQKQLIDLEEQWPV